MFTRSNRVSFASNYPEHRPRTPAKKGPERLRSACGADLPACPQIPHPNAVGLLAFRKHHISIRRRIAFEALKRCSCEQYGLRLPV